MFTAKDIKNLMETKPFIPFRIRMSDGSSYEVSNHDAALVSRNFVDVATKRDSDKIAETIVRCSILHISQIENVQAA